MSKRRASMREGPLADLFRATDEAEAAAPAAVSPRRPVAAAPCTDEDAPLTPPTPLAGARRAAVHARRHAPRRAILASIRVVGVGGAGMNAVARMIETDLRGVEFVAVNTDAQQLAMSDATVKVALGREQTRGLGAGGDYELGKRVAEAGSDRLREALRGSDMVFVAVGEGGGTGSGAAPVVARLARELGALTVAIVTMPFGFEGSRRQTAADLGLERLAAEVDTVIVVPNDRLLQVLDRGTSMLDAFRVADDVLRQGVQGICDLITRPGLINLDFADVRTVMQTSGNALMGVGMASGATPRRRRRAQRAIASPLLGREIRGASGIVLSIAGGDDLGLVEVTEAADDRARGRDGRREHHLRRLGRSRSDRAVLGDGDRDGLRRRRRDRGRAAADDDDRQRHGLVAARPAADGARRSSRRPTTSTCRRSSATTRQHARCGARSHPAPGVRSRPGIRRRPASAPRSSRRAATRSTPASRRASPRGSPSRPSPGPAGGGFMLVHDPRRASTVAYDFFTAVPGLDASDRPIAPLEELRVEFGTTTQLFLVGPGLVRGPGRRGRGARGASARGSPAVRASSSSRRSGWREPARRLNRGQADLHAILDPLLRQRPAAIEVFGPEGEDARRGRLGAQRCAWRRRSSATPSTAPTSSRPGETARAIVAGAGGRGRPGHARATCASTA